MANPLVSIVIPCFRQGHLLAEAIEAALGQSYGSIEVIVVNDGSDDNTDAVARGYGERIRYVAQPNRGLAAARNTGLAHSTGHYLLFLDADDLLHPDAVSWAMATLRGREDILAVLGFQTFETVVGEGPSRLVLPPNQSVMGRRYLRDNFGPPHTIVAPRLRVVAAGGFDPEPTGCEDWDCWVRMLLAGCEAVPIKRIGAYYRLSPNSMSRNNLLMSTGRLIVLRRILQAARECPGSVERLGADPRSEIAHVRDLVGCQFDDRAYYLRQNGYYGKAFKDLISSLLLGRVGSLVTIAKLVPHRIARGIGLVKVQGR